MDFCKRLYIETKDYHKQVDIHPFVELIKVQEDAGKNYMIFNIKCIEEIQKHIKLKDVILQEKLYRKNTFDENLTKNSKSLELLIERCKAYPLEHLYMFILGLLKGGNILKKSISEEYHEYLTYTNPKELSVEFKNYLNVNVINEDLFIENVKKSYDLIKNVFDDLI